MTRWPLIRHARWLVMAFHFHIWWQQVGHHLGAFPNPSDLQYLEDIWSGKA